MDPRPHEPWCVIALEYDEGLFVTMPIPEWAIGTAKKQGWRVIGRDTEIAWPPVEPTQRNPNRDGDDGA
jgi:hypothetical protein